MSMPAAPPDPERNHMCQDGCGRVAEVVIVRLSDSGVDILSDTCALAMWMAVAERVTEEAGLSPGA
jgi:hypothetical protein